MRLQLLSIFTNHFYFSKNLKQNRQVVDFILRQSEASLGLWTDSPFLNSFVIILAKFVINIGFASDVHKSLQRPRLLRLFFDYLQKSSDPEEQKLLMNFFSNLTFFRSLRVLILEQRIASVFEIQFKDLARACHKASRRAPPGHPQPLHPEYLEQTHYELTRSFNNRDPKHKSEFLLLKKKSILFKNEKQLFKSHLRDAPRYTPMDNGDVLYTTLLPKKSSLYSRGSDVKLKKNFVKVTPEIEQSGHSLDFLSNIALTNLALDFNTFNYYRRDFNMVTSLYVYDFLNPFGKVKAFENILNYLLHINHFKFVHSNSREPF